MAFGALERLDLNPRERRLAIVLGGVVASLLLIGLPVGLETVVHARRADNEALQVSCERAVRRGYRATATIE